MTKSRPTGPQRSLVPTISVCMAATGVWLTAPTGVLAQSTASDVGAPVKSGYAEVNGAKLYYEMAGKGHPLVLIHAGAVNRRMWDDQFEVFARHYQMIRYDVRWHGQTRSRRRPYADHEDLQALLKHLGVDKAYVMGLSLGGRIAIDFALAHPEMVAALIPVAPGLSGYQFNGEDLQPGMSALMASLNMGDVDGAVEAALRSWTDGPKRTADQVDPNVRKRVRAMLTEGFKRGDYSRMARQLDPPAIDRLAELKVPTLAIVGDLDMSDIHKIVDLLTSQVAGAKKVVIPGAAHMVNMERPAEFNRVVLEFLARQ